MAGVSIPDEAVAHAQAAGKETRAKLAAAAPVIVAVDYEQFAAQLRETLHKVRGYTYGSLAWSIMEEIDAHAAKLRGGE